MIHYKKWSRKRILDLNTEFEIEQTDQNHFLDTERLPEERSTDLSHGMHS